LPADYHPSRLRLAPGDRIEVQAARETITPPAEIPIVVRRTSGDTSRFLARAAVETMLEATVLRAGGMIPFILQTQRGRHLAAQSPGQ
jgi:aconitate hydratase